MRKVMFKGTRVSWEGRTGTVTADYPENWQTAGVEFDDEKGVIIQKLKSELTLDERRMGDMVALTVLTQLRNRLLADLPKIEASLAAENAEYGQDPAPLTAHMIRVHAANATRMRLEVEALTIAMDRLAVPVEL